MVATSDPNGSRTAALISRYTLYLSAVPIFSSLMEITSPMFAVESLLLNAYTLHVANNFDKERSNANARKVFLTSLWYLPCVMMLFLLHSRQWNEMEHHDEQDSFILHSLKAKGRELCIHEAIASKDVWIGSSKENGTTLDESKCPSIALKNITCKDDGKVENAVNDSGIK
jgi:protoheme IX farnesyltransferase